MNTNNTESNYESYVFAITEQVEQHIAGLNELSDITNKRPLTFIEKNAAQRSIQVIVESAIGCSKHFLKSHQKPVPSEARASLERVYEILSILEPKLDDMRGAIGMRNAIIHDYLNLDWNKIEVVLHNKHYKAVKTYIKLICQELIANN